MRKLIWYLGISVCIISGCIKQNDDNGTCNYPDSTVTTPANEIADVQNYLTTNNITASQHPAGFFYKINIPGNGQPIINLCSNIVINYKGKLTNGAGFDSTDITGPATYQLGQLIVGWQKGLPLISKGGKITLYIPPTLGYGSTDVKNQAGVILIPKNSILIFDIELLDIF